METKTRTTAQLWLLAIRPKTLPAAVGPVVVGTAAAIGAGGFAAFPALACLVCSVLLQVGVNLANDYFDYKNNIDSEARLGPVRVTQSGLISPEKVRLGMIISLFLAAMVFVYLAFVGGAPIVLIGIASVLAALGYSGGPFPLASNGLGELFVFLFFGLAAVGGTFFLQTGELSGLALAAAIPPGLLITAIMVVNNFRDIDTDRSAGKNTLAVILGRKKTILEYRTLLVLSYILPLVLFITSNATSVIVLPLLTVPLAVNLGRQISLLKGSELNELLAKTAKLSLIYSLLFAVGLVYGIR